MFLNMLMHTLISLNFPLIPRVRFFVDTIISGLNLSSVSVFSSCCTCWKGIMDPTVNFTPRQVASLSLISRFFLQTYTTAFGSVPIDVRPEDQVRHRGPPPLLVGNQVARLDLAARLWEGAVDDTGPRESPRLGELLRDYARVLRVLLYVDERHDHIPPQDDDRAVLALVVHPGPGDRRHHDRVVVAVDRNRCVSFFGKLHNACFIIPIPKPVFGFMANLAIAEASWPGSFSAVENVFFKNIIVSTYSPSIVNLFPSARNLTGLISTPLETERVKTFCLSEMCNVGMSGSQYFDRTSTIENKSSSLSINVYPMHIPLHSQVLDKNWSVDYMCCAICMIVQKIH
ncbi:hypothetical protein ColTof3_14526 [Colletotrichum tofieldiae]|nr:hypothetical protein ColTof3_14526 [Colletotrichum tofieldiae]